MPVLLQVWPIVVLYVVSMSLIFAFGWCIKFLDGEVIDGSLLSHLMSSIPVLLVAQGGLSSC